MKTAVEWLFNQMSNVAAGYVTELNEQEILDKAKAMEKEQCLKMLPYDLDELAKDSCSELYRREMNGRPHLWDEAFSRGFQKAIELLTFKSDQDENSN
jgi:hypothetical protein